MWYNGRHMHVDALKAEELPLVWSWLMAEPELHLDDYGPKTYEAFLEYVTESTAAQTLIFFAVRTGKKLVGSVAFSTAEKSFRGMVFSPEVRGSGLPEKAIRFLLMLLFELGLDKVTAKYFVTNKRVPKFFTKLGAQFEGFDGHTTQGGVPVQYVRVSFHAPEVSNG